MRLLTSHRGELLVQILALLPALVLEDTPKVETWCGGSWGRDPAQGVASSYLAPGKCLNGVHSCQLLLLALTLGVKLSHNANRIQGWP